VIGIPPAARFGWVPWRKGRALLILVERAAEYDSLAPLIATLAEDSPRLNFLLVTPDADLLRTPLPAGVRQVLPLPLSGWLWTSVFLSRTRPQAVLCASSCISSRFGIALRRRNIPLLEFSADASITRVQVQAVMSDGSRKYSGHAENLRGRMLRLPPFRAITAWQLRKVPDLSALSDALGHPQRILCLGNGPSSESDQVKKLHAQDFDAVFRVNHRWLGRGLFTEPQLVFAAGSKPVRKARSVGLFCVQDRQRAERTRFACLHFLSSRALVVAEDLHILKEWDRLAEEGFGDSAPTNGVIMLAVAEALSPSHSTVAGMDLFADASGAYPGDRHTPNAYGIFHSAAKEKEFVVRWVARQHSQGRDVCVIGDVLNRALAERT